MPDGGHQQFGEIDHDRPRPVLAVSQRSLRPRGLLDLRVLVPEHHRPVAAHQVDIAVAVDIPDPRAPAVSHELRIFGGQGLAD